MERAELNAWLLASGCAVERNGGVFLVDERWSSAERSEAEALMALRPDENAGGAPDLGWLCVRTGGSSGGVKFARHDERTLAAAVRGFCAHFNLTQVNAVGVLPWTHVSGLMAGVRCAMTGGRHLAWDWKRLEAGDVPALGGGDWVLSLVPTQLHRLLGTAASVEWLRRFRVIFLGGGPVWAELADAARAARLPIAISYGLTETAAMVTALRPEEFARGESSSGAALPHARLAVTGDGLVRIAGESIFRGYWPHRSDAREFTTEDLGDIDSRGRLHLLGRRDALIISGGKKIAPLDVEAALLGSGEFADVVVLGVPDPEWGEIVVACYPSGTGLGPDLQRAVAGLSPVQRPKRFVAIDAWPRSASGKINRAAVRALVLGRG